MNHTLRLLFTCVLVWSPIAFAQELPSSVAQALKQHRFSRAGLSVYVHVIGESKPRLAVNADRARNPASVIKLMTTLAALEELGPAYRWKTEAYSSVPLQGNRLEGDLYLKGYGDPYLVIEHFWRLLRALRLSGLQTITGDLVLDQSHFAEVTGDPGDFDGEETRPYNVLPRALLVNFQAIHIRVIPQPPLLRVVTDPSIAFENRIRPVDSACPGSRAWSLRSVQGKRPTLVLEGRHSLNCGEDSLFRVVSEAGPYTYGVFQGLWQEQGGEIEGSWREASVPAGATLLHTFHSPPLAEVVRSINKFSNNVMTRQLLLTIGAERYGAPGSVSKGLQAVRDWLGRRRLEFPELVLDNGAGLSRSERISARSLGRLLQAAYQSPYMPEFMSALPLAAMDGTMQRRFSNSPLAGRMHLKTGSLNDVRSAAGYVFDNAGRRVIVVYLHNDARAEGAGGKAVQDALLEWVYGESSGAEATTGAATHEEPNPGTEPR